MQFVAINWTAEKVWETKSIATHPIMQITIELGIWGTYTSTRRVCTSGKLLENVEPSRLMADIEQSRSGYKWTPLLPSMWLEVGLQVASGFNWWHASSNDKKDDLHVALRHVLVIIRIRQHLLGFKLFLARCVCCFLLIVFTYNSFFVASLLSESTH